MIGKEDLQEIVETQRDLEAEKQPYVEQWQDISTYMGLAYDKWISEDARRRDRDDAARYRLTDITAATASDTLANGVEGYACSSSLQWFDYAIERLKEGADREAARSLLEKVKGVAYQWLQKSNFYTAFRGLIRSGADLGTGGFYFDMDRKTGLPIFKTFHLADIELMTDDYGRVDTLFRKIYLTKREAVRVFGESRLPRVVTECDKPRERFVFHQMVSPVLKWDFDVAGVGDNVSIYWAEADPEHVVREERLDRRPFAIFRWQEPVGGGSWGVDSPGQQSLPVMRYLNVLQEDLITLSELTAKGHWKKTKGLQVNFKAGGVTDLETGQDFVLQQATGDLSWLAEHISYYRSVINECYRTNLFLTLTMNIDRTKTATEVAGLTQERETLMQSFWSRLAVQVFEPLHEWLFMQILTSGKLEDITDDEIEATREMVLDIDYVSPAYMAQKRAFELGPSLSWVQDIAQLSQLNPNLMDKVNWDELADIDHDVRNAKSTILISTDDANAARQARAEAEAEAEQQALQQEALKTMSDAYGKMAKAPEKGSASAMMMGEGA